MQGNIKGAADNTAIPKSVKVYEDFDAMLAAGGFRGLVAWLVPSPVPHEEPIKG